jgi:hypothetical protein
MIEASGFVFTGRVFCALVFALVILRGSFRAESPHPSVLEDAEDNNFSRNAVKVLICTEALW